MRFMHRIAGCVRSQGTGRDVGQPLGIYPILTTLSPENCTVLLEMPSK
jgi:hypothetical protein